MSAQVRPHRGTIFEERAEVLAHERFAGDQFVLTLKAPKCARAAAPGSFVHLSCDEQVPMRRPLSIMRAHPERGSIEVLYKIVGPGLGALAARRVGLEIMSTPAACRTYNVLVHERRRVAAALMNPG